MTQMETLTIKVCRSEIHAADSAWSHEESISVPTDSTLLAAIDIIRSTYSFNGVRFTGPKSIWMVSAYLPATEKWEDIALTGLRDAPTDVFDSSLNLQDLDLTRPLHFTHEYRSNLEPNRIIKERFDSGSEIARRFIEILQPPTRD